MTRVTGLLAFLLLLSPSAYIAWRARDMPHFGHLHDDALYMVSAKSIAEGHGYRILSLPGEPYQTKYPPLFAFLLSVAWKIHPEFPGNLPIAMLLGWLMFPAYLALCGWFYHVLGLKTWENWLLLALQALNLRLAQYSISLMPELMFTALLLGSVAFADRATETADIRKAFLAATLGSAAYLAKAAALPLLLSVPILFMVRRRWRCAVVFFVTMLPAVLGWNWWVYMHLVPTLDENQLYYLSYIGYRTQTVSFGDLPTIILTNTRELIKSIPGLVALPSGGTLLDNMIQTLIAGVTIAGVVWTARRMKLSHYHSFAILFLPVLLLWHFPPTERFILPLMPLLLVGLFVQVREMVKAIQTLFRSPGYNSLVEGLGVSAVLSIFLTVTLMSSYGVPLKHLLETVESSRAERSGRLASYDWIAKNTPLSSGFFAHEDPVLYLYTGRHARSMHTPPRLLYHGNSKEIADRYRSLDVFARDHGLEYLYLTPSDFYREADADGVRKAVQEQVRASHAFSSLYDDGGGAVYRIRGSQ